MKRLVLTAVVCLVPLTPALAGDGEDLEALRREVAGLRAEVTKLSAQLAGGAEFGKQLIAIARKLNAGEKIEDGSAEMAVLRTALRRKGASYSSYSDPVFMRGLGLVRKLSPAQRARLLGEVLCDVTMSEASRGTVLKELVLYNDEHARKAVAAACELEVLMPAASAGLGYRTSVFMSKLINANAGFEDKRAVDLTINTLENVLKQGMTTTYAAKYGVSLNGGNAELAVKLAHWSGQGSWKDMLARSKSKRFGGRYASYSFKTKESQGAALAELGKVKEWWKANREGFEFPKEAPQPIKPVETKPLRPRETPAEQF